MSCALCHTHIDGPHLADPATGDAYHPDCAMHRLPRELAHAASEYAAAILVPFVMLWTA